MYTLENPNNPVYRLNGTLEEIMESLAAELLATSHPIDGMESYIQAVYPYDESELDEDEAAPEPAAINEANVLAFAAEVWDVHEHILDLTEYSEPLLRGEFQAMQHHLGLSNADLARLLHVDQRRLSRWIAGTQPIPVGIARDMDTLLDQHDQDVLALVELDDRGIPTIYPEDKSEQQTSQPFGWERRVVQRAMIERGVTVYHSDEYVSDPSYLEQ